MAKPVDTAKLLDLLGTMHTKEAQMVGVLRTAGIGETTIARSMRSSPQAIAKRFPRGGATTRATAGAGRSRATTATRARTTTAGGGRGRTAKRTTAPAARARGKVGARAR